MMGIFFFFILFLCFLAKTLIPPGYTLQLKIFDPDQKMNSKSNFN